MRTQKLLVSLLSSAMVLGTMAVPALADGNVAEVNGTEYATLEEAADAVNAGATVTLLNDVTYDANHSVAVWEKAFNLDLGGKTITTNSGVDKDLSNMGYKATAVCYASGGNVAITNGTIKTAYGAGIYAAGTVATLSDLTITAATTDVQPTKEYSSAVRLTSGATVIINSGSYSAENGGYSIAVSNSGGAVTINDGTFNGDIFFSKNTNKGVTKSITINGGTFTGDFVNPDKGTLTITGGTFTSDPQAYVADGYIASFNGGTYEVKHLLNATTKDVLRVLSQASDNNTVTIKSKPADGYYEQVTAAEFKNEDNDEKAFNVVTSKGTYNITLTEIGGQTKFSGGGSMICGLVIKNIPTGETVTVTVD